MSDPADFYRAFEDRHRGTPQGVEERQRAYLPFLDAMKGSVPAPLLIDIGCGRGEWLALAQSQGWQAKGVDTDEAMLQAARDASLPVETGDAVAYLRAQPVQSATAITAFHVVEHLPFEQLRAFLDEAARVLCPGGLLLVETPNPENLVVGANSFHMDPTHVRPLPPALLAFAAQFAGFDRIATLRLHEGISEARPVELIDVLAGVSPDYAIVARKPGGTDLPAFDSIAAGMHGVTLNGLAERYDEQVRSIRVDALAAREAALQIANSHRDLLARMESLEAVRKQVAAMEASTSWRVTAPLRKVGGWRIRMANAVHEALAGIPIAHRVVRGIARTLRIVPQQPPAPVEAEPIPSPPAAADMFTAPARRAHQAMEEGRQAGRPTED